MHSRVATLRGFTLIELLVVIAIIGMLSSIVLASLNSARAKAHDTKVFSQLKNMYTQAMLYQGTASACKSDIGGCSSTGAWGIASARPASGGNFFADADPTANDIFSLTKDIGTIFEATLAGTPSSGAQWALLATLSNGNYACIDYRGTIKTQTDSGILYTPSIYSRASSNSQVGGGLVVATLYTVYCP